MEETTNQTDAIDKGEEGNLITYADFQKLDLRVAQILEAAPVEKADKLIKLRVTLGENLGERQIVAGIAKYFQPEELIGRKVIVLTNLEPRKLRGHISEGMLLAAVNEISEGQENLTLLAPGDTSPAGSVVR